jgi:hypothetical protein
MLNVSGFAFWSSAARIPSKIGQIINPVTGTHRFKHCPIGACQLDQLYGIGFGAAGVSDRGGSRGFHILRYTQSRFQAAFVFQAEQRVRASQGGIAIRRHRGPGGLLVFPSGSSRTLATL